MKIKLEENIYFYADTFDYYLYSLCNSHMKHMTQGRQNISENNNSFTVLSFTSGCVVTVFP